MGQALQAGDEALAEASPALAASAILQSRKLPALVMLEVEPWARTRAFAALSLMKGVRVVCFEEPPA